MGQLKRDEDLLTEYKARTTQSEGADRGDSELTNLEWVAQACFDNRATIVTAIFAAFLSFSDRMDRIRSVMDA